MFINTYVSQLSHCLDKLPNMLHLKQERFNLAHHFRGFSPWLTTSETKISWQKGMTEQRCLVHCGRAGEQSQKRKGQQYSRSHLYDLPRHTQKCALLITQVVPKPIKLRQSSLTIKLNNHCIIYRKHTMHNMQQAFKKTQLLLIVGVGVCVCVRMCEQVCVYHMTKKDEKHSSFSFGLIKSD